MKKSNRLLTCTLGLMLGVGMLVGCGKTNKVTHTVTFYAGNDELKSETVNHGEKCPDYTPAEKEGYTFVGWYDNRQHEGEPFDLANTPIEEDLDLYAWYKENFKRSTDTYYVVGSFVDNAWDGAAGDAVPADRTMTLNEAELANNHNVFEFTIDKIEMGQKFRMIKSTDGQVSDGWTDDYGFDLVSKVIDENGDEMDKATAIKEEDSKNIGVLFSAKLKVQLDLNSEYTPKGEIILTILEKSEIKLPEAVSFIGGFEGNNWESDYQDLTSEDNGLNWAGQITLAEGTAFKLRANHDWSSSWGFAAINEMVPAGAFVEATDKDADGNETPNGNILVAKAGTYEVTFNFMDGKMNFYTTEILSLNFIGSFTSWADGDALTQNGTLYEGDATLAENDEFKLRTNNSWHTSFGSSSVESAPEGAFDLTNDNIKVLVAGKYHFAFDTTTSKMTITVAANEALFSFETNIGNFQTSQGAGEEITVTVDGFSLVFSAGANYSTKYKELYIIANGTVTFNGKDGVTIKKVILDMYKHDNWEMHAATDLSDEVIAGTVTSGTVGTDSHVVKEYEINAATFAFKNTYTSGSALWSITLVY